jgi:hypothetical protein
MQDEFIEKHLVEMCQEMVEYRNTGILHDGRVRELRERLFGEDKVNASYALSLAEKLVYDAAVAKVAATHSNREDELKSLGYEEVPNDERIYHV